MKDLLKGSSRSTTNDPEIISKFNLSFSTKSVDYWHCLWENVIILGHIQIHDVPRNSSYVIQKLILTLSITRMVFEVRIGLLGTDHNTEIFLGVAVANLPRNGCPCKYSPFNTKRYKAPAARPHAFYIAWPTGFSKHMKMLMFMTASSEKKSEMGVGTDLVSPKTMWKQKFVLRIEELH